MHFVAAYLIYDTDGLSAVEIAKTIEELLTGLNIQAIACHHGEGKSNLSFIMDEPKSQSGIRKKGILDCPGNNREVEKRKRPKICDGQ